MFRNTFEFLRVGLLPNDRDPRPLYALLDERNLPGEQSHFLNLGYWDEDTLEFDAGAKALAALLMTAAKLQGARSVLDVGFGFGDQILQWLDSARPQRIVGINLSEPQVKAAKPRIAEHPDGDRVELSIASACALPIKTASMDRVVALESAFHFSPRSQFFSEARRVLMPKGRLATADILLMPGEKIGWPFTSAWRIPDANLHDRDEYARQLSAAGFVNVEIRSIRERVFEPLVDRLQARLREPDVVARMNPLLRSICTSGSIARSVLKRFDYIIATADTP